MKLHISSTSTASFGINTGTVPKKIHLVHLSLSLPICTLYPARKPMLEAMLSLYLSHVLTHIKAGSQANPA